MLRYLQPQKIVEIGSGYSSAVVLDTNELFLDHRIDCTFIEPYPDRLRSLLRSGDRIRLIESRVQGVDFGVLTALEPGDVLFIDSSHVSKAGSDVNHIIFNILPRIRSGVYIHFHDIFYPFEYPADWISIGIAWNELYLLRGFLQNNHDYEIQFFSSFLQDQFRDRVLDALPAAGQDGPNGRVFRNRHEGSFWMRKK
jgi:Methyltransferase domain